MRGIIAAMSTFLSTVVLLIQLSGIYQLSVKNTIIEKQIAFALKQNAIAFARPCNASSWKLLKNPPKKEYPSRTWRVLVMEDMAVGGKLHASMTPFAAPHDYDYHGAY